MKQHPTIRELLVSEDGKIYDKVNNKWLSINTQSSGYREAVAHWYTGDKKYTLDVLKLVYETHVLGNKLKADYKIVFKKGNEIHASNLTRTKKYQRNRIAMMEDRHESWLQDDIYC